MESHPSQDLAVIDNDLRSFQDCVNSIGTPLDNERKRADGRRLRSVINRRLRDSSDKIKKKGRGVEAQQLSKQLNNYADRFDDLLRQEQQMTRERHASMSASAAIAPSEGSTDPMMQTQMVAENVATLEQEAAELADLEKDILDLHEIQRDMAGLVHEQGGTVDNIEANVSNAAVRVEAGGRRLRDAGILKSRSRKLYIAIGVVVGAVVIAILLVIVIVVAVVASQNDN